jgi:methyl-accepting chemotaxis protein
MKNSIQLKMIGIFSTIVFMACLITAYLSYRSSVTMVRDSLSQVAENITTQALQIIDLDRYRNEISLELGETEYYYELRAQLNDIREKTGLTYLYTMARRLTDEGYEYFYMVDGMPVDDEDASQMGDLEDADAFPAMVEVFDTGQKQIEMSYTEEYGGLITVYLPLITDGGEVIGIIGADLDASEFYSSIDTYTKRTITATLLILVISIFIVSWFARSIHKPLKYLTNQAAQVGKGDLTITLETKKKDEIGIRTAAFQQMMNELKRMIQQINHNAHAIASASIQLLQSTNQVKHGNEQVSATIQELSSGADRQSQFVE